MTQPSALITGIAGFAGSYLAEELLAHGYSVSGTVLKNESLENLDGIRQNIKLVNLDVSDPSACQKTIKRFRPDYLFHLAAMASVGKSFGSERITIRVNVEGTLNLLDACRPQRNLKKFILISSADAYGKQRADGKMLTESVPLEPISPYGISKAAAEYLVRYYRRVYGTPAIIARSFNHTGPRQNVNFVIPNFCRQIALIEAGKQEPVVRVGDLSARRDISDVREIVRGYRLMAEKGKPGEVYQLCSGKAESIDRMLRILLSLSERKIKVVRDKSRLRKADIPILKGSNRKAVRELGFRTRIPLTETLEATLNYWRARVSRPQGARVRKNGK